MSATWHSDAPPPQVERLGVAGMLRALLKGGALVVLVFGGLAALCLLRLAERPLCGMQRPVTPALTVLVCRTALRVIGLRLTVEGRLFSGAGAVVANHSSWLDIFVLNAVKRVYFVSKSEVADWPGIGWLARATGTVFIERTRTRAADQAQVFRDRLGAGHRLLFFPEGTSSDGQRVLAFKTTLFAAFFAPELRKTLQVQPVSVIYTAPEGQDARFYGWWGDMDLGPHLLKVLSAPRQGAVRVVYHKPLVLTDFENRKALAQAAQTAVQRGHEASLQGR